MDRARRLRDFWNYLPAFRAIAECEHLPTAAQAVGLSPPALSRTLRLLEQQLGQSLFDRVGRGLRLNASGRELVVAVRGAMRTLDDGVERALGGRAHGGLVVSADPAARWLLGPWLARLAADAPELTARECPHPGDLGAALRTGDIDAALVVGPCPADGVRSERLADVAWRVYRHRTAGLGFVISPNEPWPATRARVVVAWVDDAATAAAACGAATRAFVPEPVGRAAGLTACSPILGRTPVYLAIREPIAVHVATEAAVAAARAVVARPAARAPRRRR